MKLIIAGASGFVGREVVRQSLKHPAITSVIGLSRTPVPVPEGVDGSKLKTVLVENYGSYSQEAKAAFAGAGACIWCVAITPTKSKNVDFSIVKQVCQEHTMAGLRTIYDALGTAKSKSPFRFMYISGIAAERDPKKEPIFMPEYCWMRGETENQVLAFAAQHPGEIEACVAKPGMITDPRDEAKTQQNMELAKSRNVPYVTVIELSACMLDQCLNGFEKEPLLNDDLARLGREVLKNDKPS